MNSMSDKKKEKKRKRNCRKKRNRKRVSFACDVCDRVEQSAVDAFTSAGDVAVAAAAADRRGTSEPIAMVVGQ